MRDVHGENEARELKKDEAMRELVNNVISISAPAMFGDYALRDWEDMTATDWEKMRRRVVRFFQVHDAGCG